MKQEKPRILIADDSKTNVMILNEILKGEFDIKVAIDGKQALERSCSNPIPELILLDVEMPELDGFQVCEQLKQNELHQETPIIFITSLNDKKSVLKGFEVGATDFICKPFEAEEVLARVRVHNQNIQLKHKLAKKAKEMEEFAFCAAHDLRSPLDLVDSYIDLIKHVDNLESEYLPKISSASSRLRSLINSLLSLAGAGDEVLHIQNMNLSEIIEDVKIELEPLIISKSASIELLDDCGLQCDRTQMMIIFRNLISNAIKYSREGVSPVIKISSEVSDSVEISVQDNGSGFSEEVAKDLFTPFKRFHYKVEGHGLGLSIVEKIIQSHHGRIQASGVEGEGALFEISLPIKHHHVMT